MYNTNDFGGFPLSIEANVNVKVKTSKGKLKQDISKHNKATSNLTEGVVRFLRGEFTSSYVSKDIPNIGNNFNLADQFIPSHIGIGNIGVVNGETADAVVYNSNGVDNPSYSDKALRREILPKTLNRPKITKSVKSDASLSETYSLMVSGMYQFNQKIEDFGFKFASQPTRDVPYFIENGIRKYTITEVGLFSGDFSNINSKLLARVLLDANTPIVVGQNDFLIVNWQLGVYSLDDTIANEESNQYKYITHVVTPSNIQWENH